MATSDVLLVMTTSAIINVIVTILVMLAVFRLRSGHGHGGSGGIAPNLPPEIQINAPSGNMVAAKFCGSCTAHTCRSKNGMIHWVSFNQHEFTWLS